MFQVTVLANGRRQVLKLTPNSTVLEVLEEVCRKQDLKVDDYDLKHHNSILDVTSTLRFSGIPQNGQAELVPCKKRRIENPVTLCVQLESGNRVQGECLPSDTLWDTLNKIAPGTAETMANPVVVYLRREVVGREALVATALRSIGLTGGRAAVRLIDRTLEQLRTQANVSAPLVRPTLSSDDTDVSVDFSNVVESDPPKEIAMDANEPSDMDSANVSDLSPEPAVIDCKSASDSFLAPPPSPALTTTSSVYDPLLESDDDAASTIVHAEDVSMGDADSVVGASIDTDDVEMLPADGATDIPTSSISTKVIDIKPGAVKLGERNAIAYNLDNVPPAEFEDLPDDFYELTIADVRSLAAEAQLNLKALEDAPLLTSQQRQLDRDGMVLRKISQYKTCVIRIRFPDHTVLQGCFKPVETVAHVIEFIRHYLENSEDEFYLYMTPPKRILSPTDRLVEVDCVPSAILYLCVNGPRDNQPFLREDVREKFCTQSEANMAASEIRAPTSEKKEELKNTSIQQPVTSTRRSASLYQQGNHSSTPTDSPPQKVPKWFKPFK